MAALRLCTDVDQYNADIDGKIKSVFRSQASMMELFCENSYRLKAVNYFLQQSSIRNVLEDPKYNFKHSNLPWHAFTKDIPLHVHENINFSKVWSSFY